MLSPRPEAPAPLGLPGRGGRGLTRRPAPGVGGSVRGDDLGRDRQVRDVVGALDGAPKEHHGGLVGRVARVRRQLHLQRRNFAGVVEPDLDAGNRHLNKLAPDFAAGARDAHKL